MAPLNFAGKLPVAVSFTWKGERIANTMTNAFEQFSFVIANDLLHEFKIDLTLVDKSLTRKAAPGSGKQFDKALNTYVSDPIAGNDIDDLIALGKFIPHSVDFTITYHRFFDVLLQQMTRTDADLHNLANPNDSAAILDTFTHSGAGGTVNISYKQKTETFRNITCRLADHTVTPRPGKAPAVKLVFELDFKPFDATSREVMRKLIAMDWGRLAKFGKAIPEGKTMPNDVRVWFDNREAYVANQTDMTRAERIRKSIFTRQMGKSSQDLATDLRNDIDLHLVAANHWGQDREDMKTERHQRLLSDLFGTLHQKVWLASPVCCLRNLADVLDTIKQGLSNDQYASLALQFGVGHCGEHSQVSFSILGEMVRTTGSPVIVTVRSGFANIDHAFVVYDLTVVDVLKTATTIPGNSVAGRNGVLNLFNLQDAIASNPQPGFVMDPYLDKTFRILKAKDLLANITGKERIKQGKNTPFISFLGEIVEPVGLKVEDITSEPPAKRLARVPHV